MSPLPPKFRPFRLTLLLSGLFLLAGCINENLRSSKPLPVPVAQPKVVSYDAIRWSGIPELASDECKRPHDLWQRIRDGYGLPHAHAERYEDHLKWYARHQSYLERVAERATPYMYWVLDEINKRGMPTELTLLPIVESAFQPFAYSHGRAAGLWQIVPMTGRRFGLKQDWWYDGRRDVQLATQAALDYLDYLHGFFDGDWLLAIAAYNAGEGTVRNAVRHNKRHNRPTDFWSLDLPRETEAYVPKLLAISELIDNPPKYGVLIPEIADQPYLASVDVGSQIDLALAAELAELELADIYRYNPAFNRWATHPEGPHHLLLPKENAKLLTQRLTDYPPQKRLKWKRHRIGSGETLSTIAEQYRTTVKLIKQVNGMRGYTIRAGDTLLIPVARKNLERYSLTASNRRESTQSRQRDGHKMEYVVQIGDSFWDIARRFEVGIQELAKWNAMAPRDTLRVGQKLVIWTDEPVTRTVAANPANFSHPNSVTRRIGYTVRKGDSLARISQRFKVSINNLKRWNNLDGEKYLQPGQKLTLYVDVTQQAEI